MRRRPVIAIDGPGGAGKSTVARLVAQRAVLTYLDTGAMYRVVAWLALTAGLVAGAEVTNPDAVAALAARTDISFGGPQRPSLVRADGRDLTAEIRSPEVDRLVPRVSAIPAVRAALVPRQRALAAAGGIVADGRDIGTAVLPDADWKFFVTASLAVRTDRRFRQLQAAGVNVGRAEVEQDLRARDDLDASRATGPLRRAADAILIDTTDCDATEAAERILQVCGRAVAEQDGRNGTVGGAGR